MTDLKTRDEIVQDLRSPFKSVLNQGGIDDEYLIRQLKKEFRAKETKIIKVKGVLSDANLPQTKKGNPRRDYKIIGTSGVIETFKTANGIDREAGDGDTVVAIDQINWGIRQKARMDVHKLRGDYPAEKHELMTDRPLQINVVKFSDMEDENG